MPLEYKTNEEIISLLKEKFDEDLFEELIHRFMPTFIAYRSVYEISGYSLEDYVQEGRIIFYELIDSFDPKQSKYLAPYFKKVYRNHLISLLRGRTALKRKARTGREVYLDANYIREGPTNFTDGVYQLRDSRLNSFWELAHVNEVFQDVFMNILSKKEQTAVYLTIKGHDDVYIANQLATTPNAVKRALDRARDKLRKFL